MTKVKCCHSTYGRVRVSLDVTFVQWEKEDASATVDDVTDSVVALQKKIFSKGFNPIQQILNEFVLRKEKQALI